MDITVPPSSCTNSSNCSRSVGVIWALTCAVRFSRLIGQKKKPAPSNKGGRTRAPLGRGKARVGGDSCSPTLWPVGLQLAASYQLVLSLTRQRNSLFLPLRNGGLLDV